ncbi:RpiB/LacA/LacB family sugar-phosphate isomerase [bacterium]|nr:RpiB/LacA/LacB family sugar-phosphate isomerase [bacterium]
MKYKFSIASDHGGFELKEQIIKALKSKWELIDRGPSSNESVDYTDYAILVASDVINEKAEFGILICTTGIGMSIAANKVNGIRAALVCDVKRAELARRHNNANIICLGAVYTELAKALEAIRLFDVTKFDGELAEGERHKRRVEKIIKLENQ